MSSGSMRPKRGAVVHRPLTRTPSMVTSTRASRSRRRDRSRARRRRNTAVVGGMHAGRWRAPSSVRQPKPRISSRVIAVTAAAKRGPSSAPYFEAPTTATRQLCRALHRKRNQLLQAQIRALRLPRRRAARGRRFNSSRQLAPGRSQVLASDDHQCLGRTGGERRADMVVIWPPARGVGGRRCADRRTIRHTPQGLSRIRHTHLTIRPGLPGGQAVSPSRRQISVGWPCSCCRNAGRGAPAASSRTARVTTSRPKARIASLSSP